MKREEEHESGIHHGSLHQDGLTGESRPADGTSQDSHASHQDRNLHDAHAPEQEDHDMQGNHAPEQEDHDMQGNHAPKQEDHDMQGNHAAKQDHGMHDSHAGHHGHGQLSGEQNAAKVQVEWKSNPEPIESNRETEIFLDIKDASGKAFEAFTTVHEKEMHLLAIKKDLSVFQHLHPDYLGKGRFQIKTTFPQAGRYKLYADFLPEGANQQLATHELVVTGQEANVDIEADQVLRKTVDDLEFELTLPVAKVDEPVKLVFELSDQAGDPVTDLEPYLGSAGHVVIVSEDMNEFLHVHPADEKTKGPKVEYMTSFPKEGFFKIWGQFKHKSKLYTVSFVIAVE
ncbi:hypothetical protein [Mesobacillus sp. S13]|uniref:hypothetical protein n=1 Tax=Mesobacillus sp. S13 TaxID=2880221 RepID=UPI001CF21105|nr:hypothetical protein [Mesobacillus sp. S13]